MTEIGRTGAGLFVDALAAYGVTHLFGNPGTTELPLVQAVAESDVEYVLGVHEDVAVGAAAGYATARRYHAHDDPDVCPLGVANLHLAGGLAHGLGNLYNASVSGAPLLVTAGNHSLDFRHEEPILSGDLEAMTDQFTKWSAEVTDVAALPAMVRRAVRTALTPPTGPVFLALPLDVLLATTDASPEPLGAVPTAGRGDADAVERAAAVLADATEPVLVLGDEVARSGTDAVEAAVALAEAAGARVHGEAVTFEVNFPADHEQWAGVLPPSESRLRDAMGTDALALVGCSTNTTVTRHEEPLVTAGSVVEVTNDADELGKRAPTDVGVIGDPGAVMATLAERVAARVPAAERDRRLARVRERVAAEGTRAPDVVDGRPTKVGLARALSRTAPDALVVAEGVSFSLALHEGFGLGPTQLLGTKGGGLGYGLPAAVGAALAEREAGSDRRVVGFLGDGAYLYYPNALYTAVRRELDLAVVVPNNRTYRVLTRNTATLMGGAPEDYDHTGMEFDPPVDLVANAASYGADAERVRDPDAVDTALDRALASDGPSVLDVRIGHADADAY